MKKFILTQLAKMGIVVTCKEQPATPKESKPAEATTPPAPRLPVSLMEAVARQSSGELLGSAVAPVEVVQPIKPPKASKAMRRAPPPVRTMADAFEKKATVSFFDRKFVAITAAIAFNPAWANGTDYYDNLPYDIDVIQNVMPGQLAKCCDDHGRRMIIIGTQLGPVVVFQRYSDGTDTVVFNARPIMTRSNLIRPGSTRLSDQEVEAILGSVDDDGTLNISARVDAIVNEVVPEAQVLVEQE